MTDLKFLIILMYMDRPNIVKNALLSIKNLTYDNWELAFIDDSSKIPGEPVVREMLADKLDKIKFFRLNDTIEEKYANGGARFGMCMNRAIDESDADIVITLCDDDALVSDYLEKLNEFFNSNPDEVWAYCHVIEYNPEVELAGPHLHESRMIKNSWYNRDKNKIMPACQIDSSQVVFRKKIFVEGTDPIRWPHPYTSCLDAYVFDKTQHKYGSCPWAQCYGQYKGLFPDQLGKRKEADFFTPKDRPDDPTL